MGRGLGAQPGNIGGVGGVADPGLGQPSYMPGGGPAVAAPNVNMGASPFPAALGANPLPQPQQPTLLSRIGKGAGQAADFLQPIVNALPGQQQPQGGGRPMNFNMPNQSYIPPPQPMNNPYAMSNAFYGG